jgi:hypothetical protein
MGAPNSLYQSKQTRNEKDMGFKSKYGAFSFIFKHFMIWTTCILHGLGEAQNLQVLFKVRNST